MNLKHFVAQAAVILAVIAIANRTTMGRSLLGGTGATWF